MADIATLTLSETTQANGNSHTEGTIHATGDCQTSGGLEEAFVDRVAISANTPELVPGLLIRLLPLAKSPACKTTPIEQPFWKPLDPWSTHLRPHVRL